jgi:hypothetical protein
VTVTRRLSVRKRLERLENLRRKVAGAPYGAQPDVTTAISEYLESLREWCRSAASEKPGGLVSGDSARGNLEALRRNPIGAPVRLSVGDYRKMIAAAEKTEQENR